MTGTKFNIEKFDGKNDFALWQVRVKDLLEQQRLAAALEELPATIILTYNNFIQKKAFNALILCLGDRVQREITKEMTTLDDLAAIDTIISDEDQALLLLTSLPSSNNNFMETLLYGPYTLKLEYMLAILNFRVLQKMMEAKGDVGEGLYVKGSFGLRDMEQGTYSAWSKSHGRSSRLISSNFGHDGYVSTNVIMAMSVEELLDWIIDSRGISCTEDMYGSKAFTMKTQSGKIKVIRGSLVVLSGIRRANGKYTLDGQAVTRKTLMGRKQLREYQTG
ncbi:hypothetical protein Tco_0476127 [Tanacetum coccineum]